MDFQLDESGPHHDRSSKRFAYNLPTFISGCLLLSGHYHLPHRSNEEQQQQIIPEPDDRAMANVFYHQISEIGEMLARVRETRAKPMSKEPRHTTAEVPDDAVEQRFILEGRKLCKLLLVK